jgi:UDP-N-acetylmuramoyl-L-alanyl-D-glutamate--2,6-diaminopimelate ligase
MKLLSEILKGINVLDHVGGLDVEINSIEIDSRKVQKGSLFVAIKGNQTDGHLHIKSAIENGASAIVANEFKGISFQVPYAQIEDTTKSLGWMASNFYNHPSQSLKIVAVTGTNGKTTTATLLYDLFINLGFKSGLLSTVVNKINSEEEPSQLTTPDAVSLQRLLAKMRDSGCTHAFMEASSHAIHQNRLAGVNLTGAVFTNITHDHLDYHITFKNYLDAKKLLFDSLPKTAFSLINIDDKNGRVIVQNTESKVSTYALKRIADFKAKILENNISGLHMIVDETEVYSKLIGEFNAYNFLAVYGVGVLLGIEKNELIVSLSNLHSTSGRFEYVRSTRNGALGIVDYAHTPDALEQVLSTISKLKIKDKKTISVIGCGGDRDRSKRPEMAKIASEYSSMVILTSDNPRSEDPMTIIKEMETGIPENKKSNSLIIVDREQAIKAACNFAGDGDIVLVAGKGHEKYQEVKGVKYPFDDKVFLKQFLN